MMNIDLDALQETKKACHEELDKITHKYNTSHFQLLYQYIIKEFKMQFIFSLMGMIVVCALSYLMYDMSLMCVVVYFMFLGCMAILEHIKNDLYQMKELVSVSYIQEGRSFLYRSIVMGGFQLFMFVCLCLILPFDQQLFIKTILYALLPIYISQIICIYFIKYISNAFVVLVNYLVFYLMMLFVFEYYQIADYMNLSICLVCLMIIFIVYVINTAIVYRRKKERDIVWN